ncbi:MAG: NosD domain-containing protein [Candidatus Thermoplasmatota archaeon]|nr:NosD domain-containing protein [Candidatus Thermoplasmatota archaeon]
MNIKKFKGREGVSEVLGTVLLLGVAVIIFSSLIIYVLSSTDVSPSAPDVHFVGSIDASQYVVVEHRGGESIPIEDLNVILWKGDEEREPFESTKLIGIFYDTNTNGRWDIGDYIKINCTQYFGQISRWQISIAIIDKPSNSVVMSGVLQHGILHTMPPVARFTYQPWDPKVDEIITFNASESYDPDGGPLTYVWDFGDGNTGYGVVPTHAYDSAGNYTVWLTVTDDEGESAHTNRVTGIPVQNEENINVTVNQPPTVNFSWEVDVEVDGTVNFQADVTDPDGNISNALFDWRFGDGQRSPSKNPSHTYNGSGSYTVTLIVTDENGAVTSYDTTITVPNLLPIAGFTTDRANITTSSSVTFDGGNPYSYDKDGSIVSWEWDFENDSVWDATGSTVSHLFDIAGNYTVVLRVTDDDGGTATETRNIRVWEPAQASAPRFLFVDNTPTNWDSGINNILNACQDIMPSSDYSYGKALDQWTFTDDSYTSEDLRGESITEIVLNQFDIIIWSTGDFPGDGGSANQYPYSTYPNYWSTSMTEGGDDVSDHVQEIEDHMTGNQTAGVFLMCGTYAVRDLVNYPGNGVTQSEIDLGTTLGLYYDGNYRGGIDYDPDNEPFSGRLDSSSFQGKPYTVQGTMYGVAGTSAGPMTINITSPMKMYGLNKQSDPLFNYSLTSAGEASTVTLLEENFDGGSIDSGWGHGGYYYDEYYDEWEWGLCGGGPGIAYSGSKCVGTDMSGTTWSSLCYNRNAYCWWYTPQIDLSDCTGATLEFYDWHKFAGGDELRLRVYDGSSYYTLHTYTGQNEQWTHRSYDLSTFTGDQIRIYWVLEDNRDYYVDYGYYLDSVWINASQQSMPSANFAIDATREHNRSVILGFDLNADQIHQDDRKAYLINLLSWLSEGAGYITEVWVNNDPPEGWLDDESHVASIEAGIDAVPPGGTVYVIGSSGQVYNENVVVNKAVKLIGVDTPILRASGTNVVTITADWARLQGFTIEGNSADNALYMSNTVKCTITNCTIRNVVNTAILLSKSHNNTISNNLIHGASGGISASMSLGNRITGNTIRSNTEGGIYLYKSSLTSISNNDIYNNGNYAAVVLDSLREATVSGNTIHDNTGPGIHLISSSNKNIVSHNIIQNNSQGISFEISNNNIILGNTITGNRQHGIYLVDYSNGNTIRENTITGNNYGLWSQDSSNFAVLLNTITNNQNGIRLSSSSDCNIQSNTISNHTNQGVYLLSSSNNNLFSTNTITNNSVGVSMDSTRNNTFQFCNISANRGNGVYLYYAMQSLEGENIFTNNTISWNAGSGVSLHSSTGNTIHENNIYCNTGEAIKIIMSTNANTITNNTFRNNSYGLYIDGSSRHYIANNTIFSHLQSGIYLLNSASLNSIIMNSIHNNTNGITLRASSQNNISGNTVENNHLKGILLTSSSMSNTIRDNLVASHAEDGIYVSSSDINTIHKNTITNNFNGIHLVSSGGTGNTILNNTVNSNANHGVYLENSKQSADGNNQILKNRIYGNTGNGIHLTSSKGNAMQNNDLHDNNQGICLYSSNNNDLSSNVIYGHGGTGIYISNSNDNTVLANQVSENTGNGLYLNTCSRNAIENNSIFFNQNHGIHFYRSSEGSSYPIQYNSIYSNTNDGMFLNASDANHFIKNNIWNNTCGLRISHSNGNEISQNNISTNGYGVYIAHGDCTGNSIWWNNFINNTLHNDSQAYDAGNNSWHEGTEGNYWSNHLDSTPYTIPPSGVQDKYPLRSIKQWWL